MKSRIEREKVRRLARWANGEAPGPVRIDLEPTFGCNLKCRFCWQRDPFRLQATNYTRALGDQRLLEIVDEAAELFRMKGDWERSEEYLRESLELLEGEDFEGVEEKRVHCLLDLADLSEKKGEKTQAKRLLEESVSRIDSWHDSEARRRMKMKAADLI